LKAHVYPVSKPEIGDIGLLNLNLDIMPWGPPSYWIGMRFNHAIMYVGKDQCVEAWTWGAQKIPLDKYHKVVWYRVDAHEDIRKQAAANMRRLVGTPYDYPAQWGLCYKWFGIDMSWVYGLFDPFRNCSALVAEAYRRTSVEFVKPGTAVNLVMPDELIAN
jgi:uncharacterized protein YycO